MEVVLLLYCTVIKMLLLRVNLSFPVREPSLHIRIGVFYLEFGLYEFAIVDVVNPDSWKISFVTALWNLIPKPCSLMNSIVAFSIIFYCVFAPQPAPFDLSSASLYQRCDTKNDYGDESSQGGDEKCALPHPLHQFLSPNP